MRLKGEMVIELTDTNTGAVETVQETNMITEAVNNILGLNPMGIYLKASGEYDNSVLWNGTMLPICLNMIGGILLFPAVLEEKADHIYEQGKNLPVAYASNNVNSGSSVYQALPWNHRGWHCGSGSKGSGNNTHIGVEMCEPACIRYTSGSGFTCSDLVTARASAVRTYEAAVELFAMLCKKFDLDPLADGVVISHREGHARGIATNHGDPEHLWKGLGLAYTMDGFRKAVKAAMSGKAERTQASVFLGLSDESAAEKIGVLCAEDMKTSGILASVSAAQFILESGYGRTELAQKANNCFGMKCVLSGNSWSGSAWDGTSKYQKKTQEDDGNGNLYTVTADFRKYSCVEQSVADHSAYLLGAMNGKKKRYAGLAGERDYRKAVQIIKEGGYATDSLYVQKICVIIEKYGLTRFDGGKTEKEVWYRVRKNWQDAESQVGAFKVLDNAKTCADEHPGFSVFDENGKAVYSSVNKKPEKVFRPYLVRVEIPDLNIRKKPGTDQKKTRKYTGAGCFTIVAEADGVGASKWGLLKAYEKERNGWISLDFATRI